VKNNINKQNPFEKLPLFCGQNWIPLYFENNSIAHKSVVVHLNLAQNLDKFQ
jgi:hypothetical protein